MISWFMVHDSLFFDHPSTQNICLCWFLLSLSYDLRVSVHEIYDTWHVVFSLIQYIYIYILVRCIDSTWPWNLRLWKLFENQETGILYIVSDRCNTNLSLISHAIATKPEHVLVSWHCGAGGWTAWTRWDQWPEGHCHCRHVTMIMNLFVGYLMWY